MGKEKCYSYTYEDWEENDKNGSTLIKEIMEDEELPFIEALTIGCWGEAWDDSAQILIDGIVQNKEKFSNIKRLFIGDMESEECEVSWIVQGDYSKLWEALPQLESLTVKGSQDLKMGNIVHENLKELQIICGGLPENIIEEIEKAKLPLLEKLVLYIGVEDYGFDGSAVTVKKLLENSNFPNLSYLGIVDSEIQDELAEAVVSCKYMDQIATLDLSKGSLTDRGGQVLYDTLPLHKNITKVNLEYHYLSEKMMEKLKNLEGIEINLDDRQEAEEYGGEIWYDPMLTE